MSQSKLTDEELAKLKLAHPNQVIYEAFKNGRRIVGYTEDLRAINELNIDNWDVYVDRNYFNIGE